MNETQPSRTAQRVALRRAGHQLLDEPRILEDPIALQMIGRELSAELQRNPGKYEASPVSPFLRAFLAARSRYAEDELAAAVQRGVGQYVVLGAGLDTFAYRNPYPEGSLRVFEVDHPATQAFKRDRLEEMRIVQPSGLSFVAVDFGTQTLRTELEHAGYDCGLPGFFSWLGVTPYLTSESVMETLRFVASTARGSQIVFDYGIARPSLNFIERRVFDALAARVAAAGEPWLSLFDTAALKNDLEALGFQKVETVTPEEINLRYFKDRKDGLRVGNLGYLMNATV